MLRWIVRILNLTVIFAIILAFIPQSDPPPAAGEERVRAFTRPVEFDYVSWMADALLLKQAQAALNAPRYLTNDQQHQLVNTYLKLVGQIYQAEDKIELIYADPNQANPAQAAESLRTELAALTQQRSVYGPLVEAILQQQLSAILAEKGISLGGQPFPPTLFHSTPLPYALIISPRQKIEQTSNISLNANLTLEQMIDLEERVSSQLNVSAMVFPVGGVGVYPTMVMSTTDLNWLAEVIAHEWTHNLLTTRPLGVLYFESPELRTINETTASIAGKEIGAALLARFYPERVPPPPVPTPVVSPTPAPAPTATPAPTPPPFNFNREMYLTRVHADELLKAGQVDAAEQYMEERRVVFWDNGYLLRKLNQAYFAFHGAYADTPGTGAAGEDPVGPVVVALRAQNASLADFLNQIAWVTSFEQLQGMIKPKP